jgi:hypothetical protein
MTCPDTPQRRDPLPDEASRPPIDLPYINLKTSFHQAEVPPPRKSTPLLALLGRITILGFVLAWGVALLQAIQ